MVHREYNEEQIIAVLKEAEAGATTADLCRKYGMSAATLHEWTAETSCLSFVYRTRWTIDLKSGHHTVQKEKLSRGRSLSCSEESVSLGWTGTWGRAGLPLKQR